MPFIVTCVYENRTSRLGVLSETALFGYWILFWRYFDLSFATGSSCWTQRSCGSMWQFIAIPFGSLCPFKRRTVTSRPRAPWYKPEVVVKKNIRKRLERKWVSTRLLCDREQYVHQCYVVNSLIESLKSTYYTDTINEYSSDQRILFKTVGKLLQKSTNKRYPPSSDDTAVANSFADFFTSKIDRIHHGLVERKIRVGSSPPDVKVCGA